MCILTDNMINIAKVKIKTNGTAVIAKSNNVTLSIALT